MSRTPRSDPPGARQGPGLAADLEREVDALAERRAFGLNFERHVAGGRSSSRPAGPQGRQGADPAAPRAKRRRPRTRICGGVASIDRATATATVARARRLPDGDRDDHRAPIDDLVVVAEFRDPIYPGLVSTGKVERGGDKPYHTVINAENFHALQTLLFTHRGKVDCIYIDPPYNTGAKDWKYNNDYVEGDDLYRHSSGSRSWSGDSVLAKELLNPDDSVLIVTIDEKEVLRLGLLLEQTFPEATASDGVDRSSTRKGIRRGTVFVGPTSTSSSSCRRVPAPARLALVGVVDIDRRATQPRPRRSRKSGDRSSQLGHLMMRRGIELSKV